MAAGPSRNPPARFVFCRIRPVLLHEESHPKCAVDVGRGSYSVGRIYGDL